MLDWLVSYPKSGNTWLRAMVAAYLHDEDVDLNVMYGSDSDVNPKWFQSVSPVRLNALCVQNQLLIRHAGLLAISMYNKPPFILKTHNLHAQTYDIPLFPKSLVKKVFYLVRDPRDVTVSLSHHLKKDIDTVIGLMNDAKFALQSDTVLTSFVGDWSTHFKTWQMAPDVENDITLIKYEELLEAPAHVFAFFLSRWGIKPDAARIMRAVERTRFDKLAEKEAAHGFKETPESADKFFRVGQAGQWRDALTDKQAATICENHGDVMKQLGYF